MMNNIIETITEKRIVLFISKNNITFFNNILNGFQLEKIYTDNTLCGKEKILSIIKSCEADKINNNNFLFLFWFDEIDSNLKLVKELVKNGVNNYNFVNEEDFIVLYTYYFKKYLNDRKIDTNGDTLSIGDFKSKNFFNDKNFRDAIGDTLLPSLFNDYSMVIEGPYEHNKVTLCEGDIVFDCGANVGFFSAIALTKGCEVHSFEPITETFESLKENLNLYNNGKFHLCNFGLADREYVAEFYVTDEESTTNSMILTKEGCRKAYFQVMTVDQYVTENNIKKVDFIKADIEGAERYMLLGAKETIKKYSPKLSICTYHLQDDPIVIENIIKEINSDYVVEHNWLKIYAYIPD